VAVLSPLIDLTLLASPIGIALAPLPGCKKSMVDTCGAVVVLLSATGAALWTTGAVVAVDLAALAGVEAFALADALLVFLGVCDTVVAVEEGRPMTAVAERVAITFPQRAVVTGPPVLALTDTLRILTRMVNTSDAIPCGLSYAGSTTFWITCLLPFTAAISTPGRLTHT
jgi:hypothetical protein